MARNGTGLNTLEEECPPAPAGCLEKYFATCCYSRSVHSSWKIKKRQFSEGSRQEVSQTGNQTAVSDKLPNSQTGNHAAIHGDLANHGGISFPRPLSETPNEGVGLHQGPRVEAHWRCRCCHKQLNANKWSQKLVVFFFYSFTVKTKKSQDDIQAVYF